MNYWFLFLIPLMVAFLITPGIRYLALKFDVIDRKETRKIHNKLITKLGGLAIYAGYICGLITLLLLELAVFKFYSYEIVGLLFGASLMLVLGIYDDFQGSNATTKFLAQILIALLLTRVGFQLTAILLWNGTIIKTHAWAVPLTVLWISGITNAFNLVDGLDGLAAGIASIMGLFFSLYGVMIGEVFIVIEGLILAGACAGFLRHNFHPAKIFMGDTGSLFLGVIMASLALYRPRVAPEVNLFFLPALILFLFPITDTFLAIVRRIIRRQHIFQSDSSHLHHFLHKRGIPQHKTAMIFYLLTLALGIISLSLVKS